MVISIGNSFYLALAKGPINEYHVLILSITHIQSVSLLCEEDWEELEKFKSALVKFFASKYFINLIKRYSRVDSNSKKFCHLILGKTQDVVFFERNYKSGHLHINVCPLEKSVAANIKQAFEEKAEEYNLNAETIPKLTAPTQLPERGPYFVAEFPDDSTLLCRQMKQFPINFGREAVLLQFDNGEEKINWRDCLLSKEQEIDYVKNFRNEFKSFDFTV